MVKAWALEILHLHVTKLTEHYLDKFTECLEFNFSYGLSMETMGYFII